MEKGNKAKNWQLFLFAFNNGATNCYYVLTMNYIAYYANGVLKIAMLFATTMVTVMRIFDGFTDPVIGAVIDRTQTKFGKFRPFMVLGNVILAVSSLLIYFSTRLIPKDSMTAKYVLFVLFYVIYVIGYTFQTACTRSGQTCITNDPKQRPLFNIFNTVASLVGMGLIMAVSSLWGGKVGFGTVEFFDLVVPMVIIISLLLTVLAVIGIWQKDRPEFYGIGVVSGTGPDGGTAAKVKVKDYLEILAHNKELLMLIIAGAGSKLASAIATNTTVGIMLYACMMGNYNGLYLPFYVLGYIGAVPFFIINLKISQKHGQKRSMVTCNTIALVMYLGVLALLLLWAPGSAATQLSFTHINLYTIAFLVCYCIGFGSYYTTADMAIPMVADCSDYEIYRSGKYVPGMVGTLFSLVDKLVSSLSTTLVGVIVLVVLGMDTLPDVNTPYMEGVNIVVIILFCVLPMLSWIASIVAMKFYSLSGAKMREVQAVNAVRKAAIAKGMNVTQAMETWKTIEQVPEEFR